MKKNILRSGTLLIALMSAAGLVKAASPAWEGTYAGFNLAGAFDGNSKSTFPSDAGAAGLFSPHLTGGTFEHALNGTGLGIHAGENWRFGNIVVSLEGSFALTDISATKNAPFTGINSNATTAVNSLFTLTPRIGYAAGNWMPYAKAGLALAEINSTLRHSAGRSFQQKHLHDGWTAGVGIEYDLSTTAMGNWILGLEYNYYQFLGKTYGGQPVPDNFWPVQYDLKPNLSALMLRASYNFGARPARIASGEGLTSVGNWDGIYVGLNGFGVLDGNSKHTFPRDGGALGLLSPHATGGSFEQAINGAGLGVHAGQNRQFGNFVIGLEAGFALTDTSSTKNGPFNGINSNATTAVNSLSAITPRVGYALGNWLPYAKAGLALAEINSTLRHANGTSFQQKHLHDGWTAGVGVEYALPLKLGSKWIVGLDYSYYQFSGKKYGGRPVPDNTWPVQYELEPNFSTLAARISYKF